MSWFPIGPDFVYSPRDTSTTPPARLSKRNQYARQGRVVAVAVDPHALDTIYTIDSIPYFDSIPRGGSAVFSTTNGGESWTSLFDALLLADPTIIPTCIAVHPVMGLGNHIYVGTYAGTIYHSSTSGSSWDSPVTITAGNQINQLIIDPRGTPTWTTTTIFASTSVGMYASTTGGTSWGTTPVLAGSVRSMSFGLSATSADCYIGIAAQGPYYSNNPTSAASWTPISGVGLPSYSAYPEVFVACCPANSQRAYAYFQSGGGALLFTTDHGGKTWKQVTSSTLPTDANTFGVAPNSPGDGTGDILILGAVASYLFVQRSVDGGASWTLTGDNYHADQRAMCFAPPDAPPGTVAMTYLGCDGGLVASSRFADPSFTQAMFGATPLDYDDQATYSPTSGVTQNLGHGKTSVALHWYAADPSASAIGYVTSDDTGTAAHSGALGWRGIHLGDDGPIACTTGSDGVKLWAALQSYNQTTLITDTGAPGDVSGTSLQLGSTFIYSASNHVLTSGGTCVAGVTDWASPPTITCVVNMEQSGTVTQISQNFAKAPVAVAACATDPQLFACCTGDNRVWITHGVPPGIGTWNEATTGKPAIPGITVPLSGDTVVALAIDNAGNIYALLRNLASGSTSPLYSIATATGAWTALTCSGVPSAPFNKLVVDPVVANTLYAAAANRVYKVELSAGTWTWTEVGAGTLPGPLVQDLWIGNIGSPSAPKVILRAAPALRGVWETDVTAGATDPPPRPYMRDHYLDQGWFAPSVSNLVDPYNPAAGGSVWWWQSADVKVDAEQEPGAFYQTDPEGLTPPSHVHFDLLRDNSQALPSTDTANVYVQVHNRSLTALTGVKVWALYTSAAAGVPALDETTTPSLTFPFWNQFQTGGVIMNTLPSNAKWQAVGAPVTLDNIDAAHPQVASWSWPVPALGTGDPGHYCIVAFVHSAENPVGETNLYVDQFVPQNPQIAQKNLHIGAPLPMGPKTPPGPMARWREYIEFHNAEREPRVADLVFDLRPLPRELQMFLRLSAFETEAPLEQSLEGIEAIHHPGLGDAAKAALLAGIERGEQVLEWLDRWLDRAEAKLEGRDDDDGHHQRKRTPVLRMAPPIYRANPSSLVAVRNVRLSPRGVGAAVMAIENGGQLPPGKEYRFDVRQVVRGKVVGGSTYVVRIARH